MNWIDESGSVPRGLWEQPTEVQEALDKWKQDIDDNVRRTVKLPYNPMNWIDEKVDELFTVRHKEIPVVRYGGIGNCTPDTVRTALQEAHQRGVEAERKRVLEWAKADAVDMDWGGFVKAIPLNDLINFINK